MVKLLLPILPGAFHSPSSYERFIDVLKCHKKISNYNPVIKCIDYQRLRYLKQNKMATIQSYVNESVDTIKEEYYDSINNNNDKCLIYVIGHSMGSRISQMVVNNLIKYENFKFSDISGMIHIAGTVFQNGQNYKQLNDKHNDIEQNTEYKQSNNVECFNYINDEECWMKIKTSQYAQYIFINDVNKYDTNTLNWFFNTLQPEISSNLTYNTVYDENIVNTKNIPNLYVHTMLDKCINIELQKEMCNQFGITDTIMMNTGHNPFVSKPTVLANHICKWIQKQTFLPK